MREVFINVADFDICGVVGRLSKGEQEGEGGGRGGEIFEEV